MTQDSNINQESRSFSSYESQIDPESRVLDQQVLQNLHSSLIHLNSFIKNLNENTEQTIGEAMFRFCGKYKDFQMTPKNVINLLEKRIERMQKNKRRKKNWNSQDAKILIWIVSKYVQQLKIPEIQSLNEEDWKNISQFIPGSTPESCMFKILNLKRTKLSNNKWSSEQSAILSEVASKSKKKNWRKISQKLYLTYQNENKTFRNAKQCKQHWVSFLNPDLKKGSWDNAQDKLLFEYVLNNSGKKRWSALTKIIKGRTENALKNRYNVIIERESLKNDEQDQIKIALNYLKRLKLGMNRTMYLNRKKPSRKEKQVKEISKSETNLQIEKKEQVTPQNNANQWVKLQQRQTVTPQIMMPSPNFLNNNQYLCPIIFNPNMFYLMPQSYM